MIDVTVDRDKYIGGSDIPIIMGISPFKSRWELLLEKAEPSKNLNTFSSTDILEYGHTMEPKIRDFINEKYKTVFLPNQVIKGDLRGDSDGFNGSQILEVKTTSQMHDDINGYKKYIVQMLFYMELNEVESGILAVYERPSDFDEMFNPLRLQIFEVNMNDYKELVEEIHFHIEKFREDLAKVKANPFITEEDLQPKEIVLLANQATELEMQLTAMKQIEAQLKGLKDSLKFAMQNSGIKKWITNNGTRVTLIPDGEDTMAAVFDLETFKEENPELYEKYMVAKKKKGKSGYVRITPYKE